MFSDDTEEMRKVKRLIEKAATCDYEVLITGPSGAGKGVVAEEIHCRWAKNKAQRKTDYSDPGMIAVNCGSLSKELIASELFGHEKGAYTGAGESRKGKLEAAENTTLFLDEIGEIPQDLQATFLQAVDGKKTGFRVGGDKVRTYSFRLICATNKDLDMAVENKQFREDLLTRIDTIHIHIPPLRMRPRDINVLANKFISEYLRLHGVKRSPEFTEEAMKMLTTCQWARGNVRLLDTTMKRLALLLRDDEGSKITTEHLKNTDNKLFQDNEDYKPEPIDVSSIELSQELLVIREELAKNCHDEWGFARFKDGWTWGAARNDHDKSHPDLIEYEKLPYEEQELDRRMVDTVIKPLLAKGYTISPPKQPEKYGSLDDGRLPEQLERLTDAILKEAFETYQDCSDEYIGEKVGRSREWVNKERKKRGAKKKRKGS